MIFDFTKQQTVLLIGAGGMLAKALREALAPFPALRLVQFDVQGDYGRLDIGDAAAVEATFKTERPTLILNAAAYTDVDGAEKNPALNRRVNTEGPANLAAATAKVGAFLVHYSTDYVFGGIIKRPLKESDPLAPQGQYALAKAEGEQALQARLAETQHLLIRTAWLFGPGGKNFVDTIRKIAKEKERLSVVHDQVGSPTFTRDLATATLDLLRCGASGIVHVSNRGGISWKTFAEAIVREAGLSTPVDAITSATLNRPASRPAYSVLDLSRFQQLTGHAMPSWEEALKAHFAEPQTLPKTTP